MKTMKNLALMGAIALTGAVGFTACSSSDDITATNNPDYNPETNSVKTTISLSINPNNGSTTRQAGTTVQASGFRGIGSILCLPSTGDITASTSTAGKLTWEDFTAFDGTSTNYKLYANQDVAVGVDHFLFIGKALNTATTATDKLANGFTSNTLGTATTVDGITVSPVSIVSSDDISTPAEGNWRYQANALAAYLTSIANATGWSTSTNASLQSMYQEFTRTGGVTTVYNAGSAESIRLLLVDLLNKLSGVSGDASVSAIKTAIQTAIEASATVSGTAPNITVTWNSGLAWANNFPKNFGLPEGSAEYKWNASATPSPAFEYIIDGTLSAVATPINKFVYPNELYYLTKTPLKATSNAIVNWPSSVANWTSEVWTSWTDAVQANSKNIALKYNVNYGSALLATTVKAGADVIYDNARLLDPTKVGDANASNNAITVRSGDTEQNPFTLTGVIIGSQPTSVAWNFLPSSGATFDQVIYDNTMNGTIDVQTNANTTPNYTLAFDDYKAETADVNICLEFKNNSGNSFYGKNGIILNGQTFYIVGKLNLTNPAPTITGLFPTGTDEDLDTYIPNRYLRAFIQDYTTIANFTITAGTEKGNGDGSLANAVTTIPDLRTSSQTIGLSVDLGWSTGLTFDVSLGQ